jgi:hypothetical protein
MFHPIQITDTLAAEGLPISVSDWPLPGRTEGIHVAELPINPPRLAVYTHPAGDPDMLNEAAKVLDEYGINNELVVGGGGDYLVVYEEDQF